MSTPPPSSKKYYFKTIAYCLSLRLVPICVPIKGMFMSHARGTLSSAFNECFHVLMLANIVEPVVYASFPLNREKSRGALMS